MECIDAALGEVIRTRSLVDEQSKSGIVDEIQAIKVVRTYAAEWAISPERVALAGFSAAAILTSPVELQSKADTPEAMLFRHLSFTR